jgi:hypothetical protein
MLQVLVGRSLGRARGLLLALIVLLCGFQFLIVLVAAQIQQLQMFSTLMTLIPPAFQQLVGGLAFGSFAGLVMFGFVHPVVVLVLVEAAIFLAAEPAWEIESGMVDVTMARPVPRGLLLARTVIVTYGAMAAVLLLMTLSIRVALHLLAPDGVLWPRLRTILLLGGNLTAVAWWFGALSLLVSAFVRRRSIAMGVAGLAAVSLYLFNVAAEISSSWQRWRPLTPFHYYNAPALLRGSSGEWARDVSLLLGTAAVLCLVAWRGYVHRDL